jgi:putative transcriptional regulator
MGSEYLTNNIRKLRFEHGQMTQQELADKVGVTRQTIIATESGRYAPSLPLAFKIAQTFGVPIEQVFQYDNEKP